MDEYLGESYAFKHVFQIDLATPSAVIASLHGIRITVLVQSWPVTVSIESYPFDRGNLTMKSIATVSNSSAPVFANIRLSGALLVWLFTLLH